MKIVVKSPKKPVVSGSVVTGYAPILTGMYRLFPRIVNRYVPVLSKPLRKSHTGAHRFVDNLWITLPYTVDNLWISCG